MGFSVQKSKGRDKEFLYRFFTNYLLTGNGTEAYLALRPNCKRDSAKSAACRLVKEYPEFLAQVERDLQNKRSVEVMKIEDRKKWLSDVILQRSNDVLCTMKDRLAAMRELNRMDGFTEDVKSSDKNVLSADEQRELYKKQLEETFGARESNEILEGDYSEK